MSFKKNRKSQPSYKPVEMREFGHGYNPPQRDIEIEQKVINPYTIVGDCKPSKTGKSLTMRIRCSDGLIHDYTIAKSDIERLFLSIELPVIPANIREYHNPLKE